MNADDSIKVLPGVGSELAQKLNKLKVQSVSDLALLLPRKYEDFSKVDKIKDIRPGNVTLRAKILDAKGRYSFRGTHITEAVASDDTGSVRLVWYNQPYREQSLKTGQEYFISGDFQLSYRRLSVLNPSIEPVSSFPVNSARIIPIYSETKGLKSARLRRLVYAALPVIRDLPETLPESILKLHGLVSRAEAYETMHFPGSIKDLSRAKKRLGFEEVFRLALAALLNKQEIAKQEALSIPFDEKLAKDFVRHLPFKLTDAQRRAIWQIYNDLQRSTPMNRLVQGDVGSGKTVVAAMAAVMAMKQGFQVAFMAPTELLARQHAETINRLLKPLKMDNQVSLLVGSMKPAQKQVAYKRIKSQDVSLLIGTHALIQEKVNLDNLGLVIIDEQHRFGVEQRKKLQAKAGHAPHVLTMTATPIPRSLALTLYGELDISVIDQKPEGRMPVSTKLVNKNDRLNLYKQIDREVAAGRQAFVVCPLVADSDKLDASSAESVYEDLKQNAFKHRHVGLLHGKLKSGEKDEIMGRFSNHELDILVATTVIEVGVDLPNASIMIVENAERFGLAQIHQLRGRIGRGSHHGYCYLVTESRTNPNKRIRAIASSNDGFQLAELDLEIRGPGAIYGTDQHGELDLRIAKLTDTKLIAEAREAARQFIESKEDLLQYPELAGHIKKLRAVTNLN